MEEKYETLIESILNQNFATMDGFFDQNLIKSLRQNLVTRHGAGKMRSAGVGKSASFQHNQLVRGDVVSWIDEADQDGPEQQFTDGIGDFYRYLNRTCFAGINGQEFHYALYAIGSFYKRHIDQFQSDKGRKFSMVTYLNEAWTEDDGGQLLLYLPTGTVTILPIAGRVVFFKADEIEHEVMPARQARMSIAGWLLSH